MVLKRSSKSVIAFFLTSLVIMCLFITNVFASDSTNWVSKQDMRVARYAFGVAAVNGKIYAIGGYDSKDNPLALVQEYDPAADTWTDKTPMKTARGNFATATVNGKIYIIGGFNGSNSWSPSSSLTTVEEYDPATDSWATKQSMPTAKCYIDAAVLNGKIYIVGGFTGTSNSNTVDVYDPTTDIWVSKNPIDTALHSVGLATVNGTIYAIGGHDTSLNNLSTVKKYDAANDTWTSVLPMNTGRSHDKVVALDGKIYAIGGYNGNILNSVEEYNPNTDKWETEPSLITPRWDESACGYNGKLYVFGGGSVWDPSIAPLAKVETLTVSTAVAPTSLIATAGDSSVKLTWTAADGATSYNIQRSTTAGGPYTTIATDVTTTNYTDSNLTNGTTYYYVVTSVDGATESEKSNEASATPNAIKTGSKALLRITMVTGEIKEYEMTSTDVDAFKAWYNSKGAVNPEYVINKSYNLGPFSSREDYIPYDKIANFEIMAY